MKKGLVLRFLFLFLILFLFSCAQPGLQDNQDDVAVFGESSRAPLVLRSVNNFSYTGLNLAKGKPVFVSSVLDAYTAEKAVDVDLTTLWAPQIRNSHEYIYIDLTKPTVLNSLVLKWHSQYYANQYQVYISSDKTDWQLVYTESNGNGLDDVLTSATSVTTRYLGIYITTSSNGTCGLYELEIYNTLMTPTPTATPSTPTTTPTNPSYSVMFDDFNYTDSHDADLSAFGWYVRSGSGGPGPAGCSWSKDNITFHTDQNDPGNRVLRLHASTKGSGTSTSQAEIHHLRKFYEGTYAARIYFTDEPYGGGPDGDQINETFFTITPLDFGNDPKYSEVDFEYLANGGWGKEGPTLWMTTWETYNPDPWEMDATSSTVSGSHAGWHTYIFVIKDGLVKYYVDGELKATHGDKYYPEQVMSINFNLWYISGGFVNSTLERQYIEDVDWVFHAKETALSLDEVLKQIQYFRINNIDRYDDVM